MKSRTVIMEQSIKHLKLLCFSTESIGSLSNNDGDGNEKGKKSNRFRLAKQQLCTCSRFFVHFFTVVARLQRSA